MHPDYIPVNQKINETTTRTAAYAAGCVRICTTADW
jgi:hypothetical protein